MAMLLKFPTGLNLGRLTGHSRHQEKDFSPGQSSRVAGWRQVNGENRGVV